MCRWLVYVSNQEVLLADVITKPRHSIISQCQEHFLPDLERNWNISKLWNDCRVNHLINGDGFGMGWYPTDEFNDITPGLFTSATPAWSNKNLIRLVNKIRSKIIFAHVRAASPGSGIMETNCHPFQFGRFLFMHNGTIKSFCKIRRPLLAMLSEAAFGYIQGTTDTEHAGALFTDQLPNGDVMGCYSVEQLGEAVLKTIKIIIDLLHATNQPESHIASSLNFAVTDGRRIVATRYRNHPTEAPPSLYYSTTCDYAEEHIKQPNPYPCCAEYANNNNISSPTKTTKVELAVSKGNNRRHVVIASEPLTYNKEEWHLVPKNHMILVDEDLNVRLIPILYGGQVHRIAMHWLKVTRERRKARHELAAALLRKNPANEIGMANIVFDDEKAK